MIYDNGYNYEIGSALYDRYGLWRERPNSFPRVVQLSYPSPILTLEQCKRHLRIYETDYSTAEGDWSQVNLANEEDVAIMEYSLAAQMMLDGPMGSLDRCIGIQRLRMFLDNMDCETRIPFKDIVSVDSITIAGVSVDPSRYYVRDGDRLVFENAWGLGSFSRPGSVVVDYTAGYASPSNPTVPMPPPPLVQAVKLLMAHYFEHRMAVAEIGQMQELPIGVERLILPFRVY